MLAQAARRVIQSQTTPSPLSRLALCPAIATWPRARSYASKPSRPSKAPPPPSPSSKSRRPPPPPKSFPGASAATRQTSPGTSFPKDKTWKPRDGINFGDPAAATVSGAGATETSSAAVEGRSQAVQPDGTRHDRSSPRTDQRSVPEAGAYHSAAAVRSGITQPDGTINDRPSSTNPKSVLEENAKDEEPLVHKAGLDDPIPGDIRDTAQQAQAASENTPPPEESTTESTPQQPLPDLRQGIPSTFNIEFGQGSQQKSRESATDQQQDENLGLTYDQSEGQQQRDRGERDYDRSQYETSLDRRRAQMANYLYASIVFIAVTGSFYLSRPYGTFEDVPSHLAPDSADGWSPSKMYARVRARCGEQLGYYTEPTFKTLLPEVPENQRQPFTLVLSLEDLMIHTTWDREHGFRTAKRPGIDYFIRYLSQYYELVLFTSAPITMADPIIRKLDPYHFIMWPLGREATRYEGGEYVKDLTYLNRPLNKTLIIDTHAPHVRNQPENAIVLPKWSGDPKDPHTKDLVALIPFLEYVASMGIDDVRPVLKSFAGHASIPEEFARRENEARKRFHASLEAEKAKRPRHSLGSLASGLGIKGSSAMGGGMVLADGQSVAEGLAQGKMLSDQIREQGQKQYEFLEKQIREQGAQWLKDEEEESKKLMDAQMKEMKKGAFSWFGGGGKKE